MARVTLNNGYSIGFAQSGDRGGAPIVFLHGVGSDKSVWRPQLEHFGKERRSIAFDYPGYGESDPAPEGTTRDDYASVILAAMDELGVERAHICGLSLGGVIAIAMHAAQPLRSASLVLADSFAVHPEGSQIYERSIAASSDLRAMAEARVDALLAPAHDPRVRSEVIETMAGIDPQAYRIGAEAVWLADQRERARDIGAPTLVLAGTEDRITPPALSNQLEALIPGALVDFIEGAGHISNLEKPDEFNERVETFIQSVETGEQ